MSTHNSLETFDIVVIGAGMAGVMAAMSAKTKNNAVLLIEPSNVLGGQGTAGGVAGFCGDSERVNDIFAELVARLDAHELIGPPVNPDSPFSDRREYDLEWCAFFLQEMVRERGVEVLLHSRVIDAEAEDGVIRTLTISTAGSVMKVAARFVIDATGACIVPVLTGFPVIHEGANKQLPMSIYFTMWDTHKKVKPILPEGCPQWEGDNDLPMTSLHFFPTGKIEVKMKVVGFDAADGRSRSEAEMFARKYMHGLIYHLQTKGYRDVPPMDTYVLASVSRAIGVREERRIIGEHVLTETEARNTVLFPDGVAVNTYHLDFHWTDRMQRGSPIPGNPKALPICGCLDMLDPHHLTLRMMIPKGAKNLLVPGRGASADQLAMSAFRVMATVAQMGFAAGHAARQCLEDGTDLTNIDVPKLQAAIVAGGQMLDLSGYGRYLRHDIFAKEFVFEGPQPFATCHTPTLVQVTNGRFLAAWVGGSSAESSDTAIWFSERREKKWSAPRKIAKISDEPHSSPVLIFNKDLSLHFKTGTQNWIMTSGDEGRTWSEAKSGTGQNQDAVTKLDEGILARVSNPTGSHSPLTIALSEDQGKTWPYQLNIEDGEGEYSEPAIISTRVGMAIAYSWKHERIAFWHGSQERVYGTWPIKEIIQP